MEYKGICHKMQAHTTPADIQTNATLPSHVEYKFVLDQFNTDLMHLIGETIQLEWTGRIFCVSCGAKTPKSYSQGHCFKCFKTKAECDMCILKPETCHYHLGTCREESFAQNICFQPHIVYLANSSALKVGITRIVNMPTRWLDQGATQALPILKVGSRRLSGHVEILLAEMISDKTDWRKLLKGEAAPLDLIDEKNNLLDQFHFELASLSNEFPEEDFQFLDETPHEFIYPVNVYPQKISSHNLDKTAKIQGKLQGIKGQYLIMDTGVINIRKYSGYEIILSS
ncbi:DUF2797 domain-containing protein [Acinetobacter qingfengensis]|uniref:Uncharacterized protein n=1 Tax=Acinetobacter qingfengensis TaxID=1262585 RepID=A0A1E7REQ2_9GAMM|nr:DUF2797 domain-containing protein [Acinetobacter qingfengensis]KAA8735101.1 DUF2797 domain-containing protein [Acinetobacter qingfengensis]OEY97707.1 hypothetical protein BJI46_08585 [Acinetobacter qingfengensis]